jgi:hypothetical protein
MGIVMGDSVGHRCWSRVMGSANTSDYVAKDFRERDRTTSVVERPQILGSSAKRSNLRSEGIYLDIEHCDGKYVFQINWIVTIPSCLVFIDGNWIDCHTMFHLYRCAQKGIEQHQRLGLCVPQGMSPLIFTFL